VRTRWLSKPSAGRTWLASTELNTRTVAMAQSSFCCSMLF